MEDGRVGKGKDALKGSMSSSNTYLKYVELPYVWNGISDHWVMDERDGEMNITNSILLRFI